MGQGEILAYLRTVSKPVGRSEIAIAINEDPSQVSHRLKRLIKFGEVKCIELDRNQASEYFNKKIIRRMRIYYCSD